MTARSTSDIVSRIANRRSAQRAMGRRTNQPVHRKSYHAGERERREWLTHNRFPRSENNARMRALEEIEQQERYAGREGRRRRREHSVLLGVYRYLLRLRGSGNGRLDPTYQTIAAALHYASSAVKAAMKRLSELGFLRWIRRTQLLDDATPGGQYVEQISNAYVLELAGRAAAMVRRILRRPTPEQARAAAERDRQAHAATMSDADVVAAVEDTALRSALERVLDGLDGASPPDGLNPALKG